MYSDKNVYDQNGRLLIAEGQEITDQMGERLKRHHLLDEEIEVNQCVDELQTRIDIQNINRKLNISNKRILDCPAKVTSKILFASKKEPWWILINAFCNYIGWMYTHSLNVSLISLIIAIELGYSPEVLNELALGSLLHDVGKLMIPKSIIQKDGVLDEQEKLLVRQHCELGVSITQGYELPESCTAIIGQHHERNNGKGYPYGLKDDQIHPYAKIVMIADVVDAVTSYRPYRSAMKMDEAFRILKKTDNMFSKDLVAVLEKVIQQ